MGDVIEFPSKELKLEQLEKTLNERVGELETYYEELDALHSRLSALEMDTNALEKDFDVYMKQYIDEVGIENVPAVWLTYSANCMVKAEGDGEFSMIWLGTDLAEEDNDDVWE